ncbi:hypothetical protein [Nonomuraea sp. NPDC002799]
MTKESTEVIPDDQVVTVKASAATETRTWRHNVFNSPQAAITWANADPRQGPGEIIFCVVGSQVWTFTLM